MSDGTARRDWWRFFGWPRLDDPPAGAPWRTQNYSFDYGPVHFVGMESYNNYDRWREEIYGSDSFTSGQLDWLAQDLAAAITGGSLVEHHVRGTEQPLGAREELGREGRDTGEGVAAAGASSRESTTTVFRLSAR